MFQQNLKRKISTTSFMSIIKLFLFIFMFLILMRNQSRNSKIQFYFLTTQFSKIFSKIFENWTIFFSKISLFTTKKHCWKINFKKFITTTSIINVFLKLFEMKNSKNQKFLVDRMRTRQRSNLLLKLKMSIDV